MAWVERIMLPCNVWICRSSQTFHRPTAECLARGMRRRRCPSATSWHRRQWSSPDRTEDCPPSKENYYNIIDCNYTQDDPWLGRVECGWWDQIGYTIERKSLPGSRADTSTPETLNKQKKNTFWVLAPNELADIILLLFKMPAITNWGEKLH